MPGFYTKSSIRFGLVGNQNWFGATDAPGSAPVSLSGYFDIVNWDIREMPVSGYAGIGTGTIPLVSASWDNLSLAGGSANGVWASSRSLITNASPTIRYTNMVVFSAQPAFIPAIPAGSKIVSHQVHLISRRATGGNNTALLRWETDDTAANANRRYNNTGIGLTSGTTNSKHIVLGSKNASFSPELSAGNLADYRCRMYHSGTSAEAAGIDGFYIRVYYDDAAVNWTTQTSATAYFNSVRTSGPGLKTWSNVSAMLNTVSAGPNTQCIAVSSQTVDYVKVKNPQITMPAGSEVTGIRFQVINYRSGGSTGNITWKEVHIGISGDGIISRNLAAGDEYWVGVSSNWATTTTTQNSFPGQSTGFNSYELNLVESGIADGVITTDNLSKLYVRMRPGGTSTTDNRTAEMRSATLGLRWIEPS